MKEIENHRLMELTTVYVAKEISEKEERELLILLKDEENKKLFDAILLKWNTAVRENIEFNAESSLKRVAARIKTPEHSFARNRNRLLHRQPFYKSSFLKAAAVICLLVMSVVLYQNLSNSRKPVSSVWSEKTTALGQKSILTEIKSGKILEIGNQITGFIPCPLILM